MKRIIIAGIITLIAVSPLFRGLYFSCETCAFLAGLALLSVLYFFSKMACDEPILINKKFLFPGILLVVSIALSFLKALNPRENLGTLMLYAELLIVFIVLYDYFYDKRKSFIPSLMIPVLSVGSVCAFIGLMALSGNFQILEVTAYANRVGSTFQYANTAAIYFAICSIFAVTLTNSLENLFLRALFMGMGNVVAFGFFMTGSRGGYIVGTAVMLLLLVIQPSGRRLGGVICFICMLAPLFMVMKSFVSSTSAGDISGTAKWLTVSFFLAALSGLIIYSILGLINKHVEAPKHSGIIFAAAIVLAVCLAVVYRHSIMRLLPPMMVSRLERLVSQGFNEINIAYRLNFDRDALKLLPGNWLLGLGGGGWKAIYQSVQDFFYTAAFVHNHYLQLFVENGILAILSYLAIVLVSIGSAIYSFVKSKNVLFRTCMAGLLCALLDLLAHSSFDFDLSFASLNLLLWAMFAASAASVPVGAGSIKEASKGADLAETNGGGKSRWSMTINNTYGKLLLITICSALLSTQALYFAAARNSENGFDNLQKKNYRQAMASFEEAYSLDPANTSYTFELAKLYHYFAKKSNNEDNRNIWLEKARAAGEDSVAGDRYYPSYINTLTRIYLDSDMPVKALDFSQKLITCQKYNADNYTLLARCYLAAADYYCKTGKTDKAEKLLKECIEIDNSPYLHRSGIDSPIDVGSDKIISQYQHNEKLAGYLNEARNMLTKLED